MEKGEKTPAEVQGTSTQETTEKKVLTKEQKAARKAKREARLQKEQEAGAALKAAEEAGNKKKKGSKKKKDASETLDKANAVGVLAKVTTEKDLKYVYSKDCEEGASKEILAERRKKFRATVRRKVASMEKEMTALMGIETPDKAQKKAIKEKEAEYQAYAKEVYVNPKKVTA